MEELHSECPYIFILEAKSKIYCFITRLSINLFLFDTFLSKLQKSIAMDWTVPLHTRTIHMLKPQLPMW